MLNRFKFFRRRWPIGSLKNPLFERGGLFGPLEAPWPTANGIASGGSERPGAAILGGVVVVGAGSVMMAFGFRRLKARRRGIEQLRSEGYVIADAGDPMSLGVDVARGRFVPRLTLRF